MVVNIVSSIAGLVRSNAAKTEVDSWTFQLHYRATTAFCFLSGALVAAADFIGNPIHCLGAGKAITTYCWIASIYTLNTTSEETGRTSSHGSSFDGLGNPEAKNDKGELLYEKTFHSYYQWVPFVLFIQGCFFYLPHQVWKIIEGKQVLNILQGLRPFAEDPEAESKKTNIVSFLHKSHGLHKKYFMGYFACEVLNFVNVICQMFLLNEFFGGVFMDYGSKVLFLMGKDDKTRRDHMIERFPRTTKCDFHFFGVSGSKVNRDYICLLPQNILNEKIYLVMWIWFVGLACITSLSIVIKVVLFLSPSLRLRQLVHRGRMISTTDLHIVVLNLPLGDFFLLNAIGKNLDVLTFRDILSNFVKDSPLKYEHGTRHKLYPELNIPPVENPFRSNPAFVKAVNDYPHVEFADETIDLKLRRKVFEQDRLDEVDSGPTPGLLRLSKQATQL